MPFYQIENGGAETDMLETDRLLLKMPAEVTPAELAAYRVRNRAFLAPFVPKRPESYYTEDTCRGTLETIWKDWEAGKAYFFHLYLKQEPDRMVGSVSLTEVVRGFFQSCFAGCQLDGELINNGYMTEAVTAVVDYAFDVLNLHRIEANIMPRNARSLRLAQKCGFEKEGLAKDYLRINGKWEDHVHMVRRNPNWKAPEDV